MAIANLPLNTSSKVLFDSDGTMTYVPLHDDNTEGILTALENIPEDVDLDSYYADQSDDLRSPSHCIHPIWDCKFTKLGIELRAVVRSLLWGCLPFREYFAFLSAKFRHHNTTLRTLGFAFFSPDENHSSIVCGVISDQLRIEYYGHEKLLAVHENFAHCAEINRPRAFNTESVAVMLKRVHTLSTQLAGSVAALQRTCAALGAKCASLETKCAAFENSAAQIDEMKRKVIVAEGEVAVLSSKFFEKETRLRQRIRELKAKLGQHMDNASSDCDDDDAVNVKQESSSSDGGDERHQDVRRHHRDRANSTAARCEPNGDDERISLLVKGENNEENGGGNQVAEVNECVLGLKRSRAESA